MSRTLALKLDTQLAKAFGDYLRHSPHGKRSRAGRELLRKALGITPKEGADAERVMDEVGAAKKKIAASARRG